MKKKKVVVVVKNWFGKPWYCPMKQGIFGLKYIYSEWGGRTGSTSREVVCFESYEECVDWINGVWLEKWYKPLRY